MLVSESPITATLGPVAAAGSGMVPRFPAWSQIASFDTYAVGMFGVEPSCPIRKLSNAPNVEVPEIVDPCCVAVSPRNTFNSYVVVETLYSIRYTVPVDSADVADPT